MRRERDLARLVAEEAMRIMSDEQLTALREKLDGGEDSAREPDTGEPARQGE